jgi:hypothetical protein
MKEKRKPKGEEGGSVQLRDLDADILSKLQELQQHFKVGTNSKAAIHAIKQFIPYKDQIRSLQVQLQDAKETVRKQQQMLDQIMGIMRHYMTDNLLQN